MRDEAAAGPGLGFALRGGLLAVLCLAGPALAGEPVVQDRPRDLQALAAFVEEKAGAVKEGYRKALEEAGDNRAQIEKAVETCSTRREKLAMIWLVSHMPGHGFAERVDDAWVLKKDLETLSAEHLHHNVRFAVAARDRFPWARDVPWPIFLHYVLPYRGSQEKAQDYRPVFWEALASRVEGCATGAEALQRVNRWAAERVTFHTREAQDLGVLETLEAGTGRCEDMANLVIAAASTVGIPCTSAYTPWWPAADGNHAWNEAYLDGTWRSFMGCEPVKEGEPFDRIKKESLFAKVYRKRFVPPEGENARFGEDVTALYTPVTNLDFSVGEKKTRVLLAVWNAGGWRQVARTRAGDDGMVRFPDVGCQKTLLLNTFLSGDTARPAVGPFLLHTDGRVEILTLDPVRKGAPGLDPVVIEGLLPGAEYGLMAFNGRRWDLLGRKVAPYTGEADFGETGRLQTLYLLVRLYGDRPVPEGRPFVFEEKDGKLVRKKY